MWLVVLRLLRQVVQMMSELGRELPVARDANAVIYPELLLMEPKCNALMLLGLWRQHLEQVVSVGPLRELIKQNVSHRTFSDPST